MPPWRSLTLGRSEGSPFLHQLPDLVCNLIDRPAIGWNNVVSCGFVQWKSFIKHFFDLFNVALLACQRRPLVAGFDAFHNGTDLGGEPENPPALSQRLDILFANAGGGAFFPLEEVTEEHFDKYFGINVKGTLFTVQKALPLMPAGASIVINGSMVSIKGIPAFGVYAATKAALRSFARTWAVDLKGRNIRVNVVAPGTIVTPGYRSELGLSDEQIEGFKAQAAAAAPLGRTGTPEEVAAAVLFLASDDGSYVNGVELFVDGGTAQI